MTEFISLINGKFEKKVSVLDRGLSYGDGIFETMFWELENSKKKGLVEFWDRHLKRISESCNALKICVPSMSELNKYKEIILKKSIDSGQKKGVLKILITRGIGGRGYKFEPRMKPTIIFLTFPSKEISKKKRELGVKLRLCKSSLSQNMELGGYKHLNRLDSVIARSEWNEEDFFEGIILDGKSNMIEGTMTNIFFSKSNNLYTPMVSNYGIKGIMRQVVIEKAGLFFNNVSEIEINKDELKDFDDMFLTNSLIKILPVSNFIGKKFVTSTSTKKLINFFFGVNSKESLEMS